MKINQNNTYGLLNRETLTRVMTIIESTKAVLRIRNVFRGYVQILLSISMPIRRIRLLPYPSENLWMHAIRWKSVLTHFFPLMKNTFDVFIAVFKIMIPPGCGFGDLQNYTDSEKSGFGSAALRTRKYIYRMRVAVCSIRIHVGLRAPDKNFYYCINFLFVKIKNIGIWILAI